MLQTQMVWHFVRMVLQERLAARSERGDTAEKVILVAIFATAAIAIAGIIVAKFTEAANNIPTGP